MTIEEIKKGLLQKIQQVGQGFGQPKIVSPLPDRKRIQAQPNYINNAIVKLGQSPVGQAITNFQRGIESRTLPTTTSLLGLKPKLQDYTQNIKDPSARVVASFGASIGDDLINLPQRLLEGGGRIGTQVVRPLQEGRSVNTNEAVGAFASTIEPLFDIATLGSGIAFKQVAKQGLKAAGKQTAKQVFLKGLGTGAGYGATFGGLRGLAEGNEADYLKGVQGAAQGAFIGGVLGGGTAITGQLFGKIKNAFMKQGVPEKEANKAATEYMTKRLFRNKRNGQFRSGGKETKMVGGGTFENPEKIKIKHWDAVDKELGLPDNLEEGKVNFGEFFPPYKKGDIKYLEQGIKDTLGDTSTRSVRSISLRDELEDAARRGNEDAITRLEIIQDMEKQVDLAKKARISQQKKTGTIETQKQSQPLRGPMGDQISTPEQILAKAELEIKGATENIGGISSKESVPQNVKGFTQRGSYTNTRADQVASKFRSPETPQTGQQSSQGDILQAKPQEVSPQIPTQQSTSRLLKDSSKTVSSDNSIQRTVKDDFEAEMDAMVGKTFEKPFTGRSKIKNTPVDLPGDKATTDFATGSNAVGGNGIKGLPKESSDQFQAWVNRRRATELEGFLKKKEFKDLDNKGIEGIFEFQSGNKSGRFGDVKQYFDAKYKTLQDNKIEFDYRQDYLPQIWNNSQDEINQVFGRRLGTKPSFTLEALFKSYQEGIDKGLSPKFNNISDLVGWYEQKANKALADKNFFDYLGKDGQILPSGKAPQEWVTLDPDHFPKFLSNIGDEKFAGTYKAPKELADVINNYLQGVRLPFLEKVANYVSKVKNITLNFGIPGTGINMHGVNILARHTLMGTGGNPVSRFITAGKFMLAPNLAQKELNKSLIRGPKAIKDGLSLSAEDYSGLTKQATTFAQKFGKKWDSAFGAPLFEKMIPALKLSSYEELVKGGMDGKNAAKMVNNVYGGINWEQMGRGKDFQNLLRAVILAPDWAETTLRLGGNLAKSANLFRSDKVSRRYQTMMATILASYVAHNVVNKLTSGHYSYENEPSNMFNIQLGYTDDGDKRYLRPYGTGLDMVRLPVEIAVGLAKGDLTGVTRLVRNRLSIPAGVAVGTLTDQDYRGNAIGYRGTDKYGNPMPVEQRVGNITSEMASLVGVPAFTRQLYRGVSGQQGLEQSLTQGAELPFRYQSGGNSKTQKFVGEVSGAKGQELFDIKKKFQGESPFSENQKAMINQGGMPALDAVMNQRIVTRQSNQIKEVQKKAASGEISPEEAQKAMQEILKQPVKTPTQATTGVNQAQAAENGVFEYNNRYSYIDNTGKTTTIDINPPSKGNGIDAFANKDWNITKARSVWNSNLPEDTKEEIFKKLGVEKADVRYDALAAHNTDVSTQYLMSKSPDHETLLRNIITGRKESISGTQFASNGVIDALVDEGLLSKEEAKALKAIKFDKNGNKIGGTTAKGKKGKKLPKMAVKKANFKIPTSQSQALKSGKPTKIKTPNVSFDTQFSKKGSIPQAKKYQVKFNV